MQVAQFWVILPTEGRVCRVHGWEVVVGRVPKLSFRFERPDVKDCPGVPEFYADLGVVRDFDETVRILLVQKIADSHQVECCGKLIMPKSGFMTSLGWAASDFLLLRH